MTKQTDVEAPGELVGAVTAWAPPMIWCSFAFATRAYLPAWGFMWVLAYAVFLSSKWLTLQPVMHAMSGKLAMLYLFADPGMNARRFLSGSGGASSGNRERAARAWVLIGALLVFVVAPEVRGDLSAWAALLGLVLLLHFGLLDLLSLALRQRGYGSMPLMDHPLRSDSLNDLWSRRWNSGFSSLARDVLFRPIAPIAGATVASGLVFLVSGLIHDLVISVPARAGYGLPTIYFLIQFAGILVERTRFARRIRKSAPIAGRVCTALVALGPLPLLFHEPFRHNVILPFVSALDLFHGRFAMTTLQSLIVIAGALHLAITSAGLTMTRVLDWRHNLAVLSPLTRHVIWTHGAFVLLMIIGFGALSLTQSRELSSGSALARACCGFIALFWGSRLMVQFFLFDARPHLSSKWLAVGYHGLTIVFTYFTFVYGLAALYPAR